jgi:hypothetical protein
MSEFSSLRRLGPDDCKFCITAKISKDGLYRRHNNHVFSFDPAARWPVAILLVICMWVVRLARGLAVVCIGWANFHIADWSFCRDPYVRTHSRHHAVNVLVFIG